MQKEPAIHLVERKSYKMYLCNPDHDYNPGRATVKRSDVTCKKCLDKLRQMEGEDVEY